MRGDGVAEETACGPGGAIRDVYAELRRTGTTEGQRDRMLAFGELNALMGLERQYALERRFRDDAK